MPLITLGDDTKLKLKVPSKGDTNWESDFKTEFAQKIVDHDHTGVDGKGAKIAEAAIEDGAITTNKIADGAVTSVKIAADAVADIDLAPDSVGTSELKNDAVETANILDANVTTAKIADSNVTTAKIADANVTEAKLANSAVTSSKIATNAVVGSTQIVDGSISGNKLQGDPLAGGAVNLSNLADVVGTTPTPGQVLEWTLTDWDGMGGYQWAPGTSTGGGGTGINHIANPDAEANAAGYSSYADTAATIPVDGSGGSANITFTRNTINPLRGTADFKITKDAVNRQGQGVSNNFTVDAADKAKKMIISFDYDASHTGYSDGDIKIYVYDVTNTQLIRVNNEDLKAGKGTHYSQFQTNSDSTSYRLIFHIATTNAAAYNVFLDEVSVGPREITHGAIITDWQEYTPTFNSGFTVGTGGDVENKFEYRRVGENMEIRFLISLGTSGASMGTGDFEFTLPSGYNMPSAFALRGDDYPTLGFVRMGDYSAASDQNGQIFAKNGSTNTMLVGIDGIFNVVSATQPWTWTGQDFMSCPLISVPIEGWSANAKMSEEFSGRDVACSVRGLASAITINIATGTKLTGWNDPDVDTTGSFDGTNDYYVVPETGYYDINYGVQIHDEASPNEMNAVYQEIRVDGSAVRTGGFQTASGNASSISTVSMTAYYLLKGQQVDFAASYTGGDAQNQINNSAQVTYFDIAKRSSAQTILENETVAMRYTSNAGTAIANNTDTPLLFEDKDTDTHNAYNTSTGIYTFPVSGYYSVDCKVGIYGRDSANDKRVFIASSIDSSGANDITLDTEAAAGAGAYSFFTLDGSYTKYFNKGQTINVFISHNTGSSQNLGASTANMYLSIIRIK